VGTTPSQHSLNYMYVYIVQQQTLIIYLIFMYELTWSRNGVIIKKVSLSASIHPRKIFCLYKREQIG
jgi:hypothetical protein